MGRGLGRPLFRLVLTENISGEDALAPSMDDAGDSSRHDGEPEGVLLAVGETSSAWRSALFAC